MSEDDQRDNEKLAADNYSVGYKRPPAQYRFPKGRPGNPGGWPRNRGKQVDASLGDAQALMLHEAYWPVSIREGDRIIEMPAIQAVMRGLGIAAMKGNHRAQLAFKEMTETIEAKQRVEKLESSTGSDVPASAKGRIQYGAFAQMTELRAATKHCRYS